MLEVHTIPALTDNYIYLIHDSQSKQTIVIDPSLARPVCQFLKEKQWNLDAIWNTHHHWDHTGGNLELKQKYHCKIYGPQETKNPIPGMDQGLNETDHLKIGNKTVQIIETPGHTAKALCFFIREDRILFCGDSLFSLGCGRLFEGTAQQLWQSLEKIKKLPENTKIYAAHEYTEQNCLFALSIDPSNHDLKNYQIIIKKKRQKNEATLPTLLSLELKSNPFLRTEKQEIKSATKTEKKEDWETFKALRQLKDSFS